MMKRSFLLTAACGLLMSLAFSTPTQAGSTVFTSVSFGSFAPPATSPTVTTVDFKYTGAGTITLVKDLSLAGFDYNGSSFNFVPVSSLVLKTADTVELKFTGPVTNIVGNFDFQSTVPYSITENIPVTVTPSSVHATVSYGPAVPEPSSMALLGIGLTSFLAFRRFFKRVPLA